MTNPMNELQEDDAVFLSIIIPVYQVEAYLRECLTSLIEQDIRANEYEIICIDDGSTDSCPMILDEYAGANEMVRVIHQVNSGVSAARNLGLDIAKGEYVWFIDSDDLIAPGTLSELKAAASKNNCDRIAFNFYPFQEHFSEEERQKYLAGTLCASPKYKDANVWTSILKREVIIKNKLRFRNASHGEDSLFMFEFLNVADSQVVLDKTVYYYRGRPQSATSASSAAHQWKKYQSYKNNALVMRDYWEKRLRPVKDPERCANLFMAFLRYSIWEITDMPKKQAKQELKQLRSVGLFPYKVPKECTLTKSYQTTRKDCFGKVFEFFYVRQSSRIGFAGMRLIRWLQKKIHH